MPSFIKITIFQKGVQLLLGLLRQINLSMTTQENIIAKRKLCVLFKIRFSDLDVFMSQVIHLINESSQAFAFAPDELHTLLAEAHRMSDEEFTNEFKNDWEAFINEHRK